MISTHEPDPVLIGLPTDFLDPSAEPRYDAEHGSWQVFSHEHVLQVTSDSSRFSQAYGELTPEDPNVRVMWMADGRRHRDLRNLVRDPFSRRALSLLDTHIRFIVGQLIDDIERHDAPFDVAAELASPLPGQVICQIMGTDLADDERFTRWLTDFVAAMATHQTPEQADKGKFFADLLADRKDHPQGGLVDELIAAQRDGYQVDGQPLDDLDIVGYLWGLIAAGKETTAAGIASMLLLIADCGYWAELRENRELRDGAIAECLRLSLPFPSVSARATEDVTFGTHRVKAGEFVTAWLSAASRDPALFPEPGTFNPRRHPNPHMAFAWGPHRCLGEPLALLEMRAVVDTALDRWPSLHWDRSKPFRRTLGITNTVREAWMSYLA
jgi:cytochrome P450